MLWRLITPQMRRILIIVGIALVALFVFKSLFGFIFKIFFVVGVVGLLAYAGWRYIGRLKG